MNDNSIDQTIKDYITVADESIIKELFVLVDAAFMDRDVIAQAAQDSNIPIDRAHALSVIAMYLAEDGARIPKNRIINEEDLEKCRQKFKWIKDNIFNEKVGQKLRSKIQSMEENAQEPETVETLNTITKKMDELGL
jgi:hypothetical protein